MREPRWEVVVLDKEEGHENRLVLRDRTARRVCRQAVEEMIERQGGPKKRWFVTSVAITVLGDETPPWLPQQGLVGNGA